MLLTERTQLVLAMLGQYDGVGGGSSRVVTCIGICAMEVIPLVEVHY